MKVTAKLNYLGIAPRKVRLVADLIRGLDATEAESQLKFSTQRAAFSLLKLLNSAVANAKHNFGIEKENLYISKITVNTGPILKRWKARSRGMASPIKKRTSHIEIILSEKKGEGNLEKIKRSKKIEKKEEVKTAEKKLVEKEAEAEKLQKKQTPKVEKKIKKPKTGGVVQKIFRRKAF